jgi:hypothetical protein
MNNFTLIFQTVTNLFVVPAIKILLSRERTYGAAFIFYVMVISSLMHLTETKHGLQPFVLADYSQLFLTLDRISSVVSMCYGVYLIRENRVPFNKILPSTIVGLCCLWLGERTADLIWYNIFHVAWHASAYYTLFVVAAE